MQQNTDSQTGISTPDIQNIGYWDIRRHIRTSIREKNMTNMANILNWLSVFGF